MCLQEFTCSKARTRRTLWILQGRLRRRDRDAMRLPLAKFWLVAVTFVQTLFWAGAVYGWPALELIMRAEGVYGNLSHADQTKRYNFMMSIALLTLSVSGIPIGMFMDAFGPRLTILGSGVITMAGCYLFGYEVQLETGFTLIAVAGMGVLLAGYRVGYTYPAQTPLILGLISCLFDSSTVVFVIMQALNAHFGISLRWLFTGYGAATVGVNIISFILWTVNTRYDNSSIECCKPKVERIASVSETTFHSAALVVTPETESSMVDDAMLRGHTYIPVARRSFSSQLRSPEFLFAMTFGVACMFRSNLYLGTIGDYLASIGDAQDGHQYQAIVAAVLPFGVVFVPFVSWLLKYKGHTATCWVIVVVGLAFDGCTLWTSRPAQVAGAVVFTFYRAALYAFLASFFASIFGPRSLGRVSGIVYTTTALTNLCQYGLVAMTYDWFNGDFRVLHIVTTSIAAACAPLVWLVSRRSQEMGPPDTVARQQSVDIARRGKRKDDGALLSDLLD